MRDIFARVIIWEKALKFFLRLCFISNSVTFLIHAFANFISSIISRFFVTCIFFAKMSVWRNFFDDWPLFFKRASQLYWAVIRVLQFLEGPHRIQIAFVHLTGNKFLYSENDCISLEAAARVLYIHRDRRKYGIIKVILRRQNNVGSVNNFEAKCFNDRVGATGLPPRSRIAGTEICELLLLFP